MLISPLMYRCYTLKGGNVDQHYKWLSVLVIVTMLAFCFGRFSIQICGH